jgi:glycosyltransferase involved in cell wall biosynthesis
MFVPSENAGGTAIVPELEHAERPITNGVHTTNGHYPLMIRPERPLLRIEPDTRPVLAVFCYGAPDSSTVRFVANLAGPLAARGTAVHLFTRKPFGLEAAGVSVHVVGEGEDGSLIDRVQEFTHRACNAFLRQFRDASVPISLMGCEWSAVPAMSILRGIKDLNSILSLQSLERQRSDMVSEVSQAIEKTELSGLREARTILVHDPAVAEVARYWVPECADRTVAMRAPFPFERFDRGIDAGTVKARYQVGPIDPTIVYVGDLSERYGPELLIKSMPPVLKNHPQARLIIVGDGDQYWPLRVYTRYLLLEHAVRLPGHISGDALDELIEAADVIAVPSREATPWWPILAGWAARRPVVASHNAAPGLLEHEKDSVLVYPNVSSVVWGIERVLFDAELGARLGARGREKLADRYGWGIVAAQVEELMAARATR